MELEACSSVTNNMPTENSALSPGPGPTLSSVSLPASNNFFNGMPLPDGMKSMVLGVYDDARRAVYGYITDPAPSVRTLEVYTARHNWSYRNQH